MIIQPNSTILFQGDSITDSGWDRAAGGSASLPTSAFDPLGNGYARNVVETLCSHDSERHLQTYNRGISGNRVTNMRDRWQSDCFDLNPDILSILIGINDTWHGVASGTPANGVGLEEFDRVLRELITSTRRALPALTLVICDPFTTEAGAVLDMNFHPDIDDRRVIVRAIADEMADVFVPFQAMFDELCTEAPAAFWAADGVHPTPAGHKKMADFWLKHVCG